MSSPSMAGLSSVSSDGFLEPIGTSAPARSRRYGDAMFYESESRDETAQQAATRLAGRLNASKVTDTERNALLAERQQLLDKQLAGTITRKDAMRLEYVRWSLDRIDDARHGASIDKLESYVAEFQRVANQLQGLRQDLDRAANKRR